MGVKKYFERLREDIFVEIIRKNFFNGQIKAVIQGDLILFAASHNDQSHQGKGSKEKFIGC